MIDTPIPSLFDFAPLAPVIIELVAALAADRLDPLAITLPEPTAMTPWLDEREQAIFDETGRTAEECAAIRRERGGFRIIRNLAGDHVSLIALRLRRVAELRSDALLARLLDEFGRYEPVVPRHTSQATH